MEPTAQDTQSTEVGAKAEQRAELERQTKEFLAKGKKITKLKLGQISTDPASGRITKKA